MKLPNAVQKQISLVNSMVQIEIKRELSKSKHRLSKCAFYCGPHLGHNHHILPPPSSPSKKAVGKPVPCDPPQHTPTRCS